MTAQMGRSANILNKFAAYGITEDEVQEWMNQKEINKILANHPHEIWQNAKGRWLTYVPDETKPKSRRQISAGTKSALEAKIVDFYKSQTKASTARTLTMRILFPEWIANKALNEDIDPDTVRRNRNDWKRYYADDPIVDIPLQDLTTEKLSDWVKKKIASYEMGAHKFGNFSLIIRQMMDYATKKHYLYENPYKDVKISWSKALCIEQGKPEDRLIFFKDEQKVFLDYCWTQYYKNRYPVQMFVPLAYVFDFYTGLRVGELAAVKFSDIQCGQVCVQRMVKGRSGEVVPKLKKGSEKRYIPLTSEAVKVIDEIKRKRIELGLPIDGYIFAIDEPVSTYCRLQTIVRVFCKELDIAIRSPHDIRRTFISNLIDAGVDINTVMKYAGHTRMSTTVKSYLYSVRHVEEQVQILEKALAV